MNDNYSPNLFLFQSYITEVLKEGKKHIKTAPFDNIDPDSKHVVIQLFSMHKNHRTWKGIILTSSQLWDIPRLDKYHA